MQNCIRDSIEGKNRKTADNKFPILGTSGMKGIGKTTMLKYGLAKVLPDLLPDLKMPAKGAYLTLQWWECGKCERVLEVADTAKDCS